MRQLAAPPGIRLVVIRNEVRALAVDLKFESSPSVARRVCWFPRSSGGSRCLRRPTRPFGVKGLRSEYSKSSAL